MTYAPGGEFTPLLIEGADALIIRTRTRCDERLLKGSTVKHIATATIGFDHIDMEYCNKNNITVTTAAGCNARGVLQWVAAALIDILTKESKQPSDLTLGVVGVGNVGRLIAEYSTAWGFNVICCDPPRQNAEGGDFVPLEELFKACDIVTFHTPLDSTTFHMLNKDNIGLLKPNAIIINTSRGEVVDNNILEQYRNHPIYLDVWEQEPNISPILLSQAIVSTPHIAGYTLQGKANGSAMVVVAIAKKFNLPISTWYPSVAKVTPSAITIQELKQSIGDYFDIKAESQKLKVNIDGFEEMRNNYNYRNEYF